MTSIVWPRRYRRSEERPARGAANGTLPWGGPGAGPVGGFGTGQHQARGFTQSPRRERLLEEGGAFFELNAVFEQHVAEAGLVQHLHGREAPTDTLGQFAALHVRHGVVGHEQIDIARIVFQLLDDLRSPACHQQVEVLTLENAGEDVQHHRVVIHDADRLLDVERLQFGLGRLGSGIILHRQRVGGEWNVGNFHQLDGLRG
jgi:hypothetical protein